MSVKFDWLIVGAGFTGATLAERIASQLEKRVLLVDRRDHVGGNAYDSLDAQGVLIHPYGPHIFHTNSKRIFEYLSRFTSWRFYEHRVRGLVDDQFVPLPFNLTSVDMVFGRQEGTRLTKLLTDEFGLGNKVPILKMRESSSRDIRRIADLIYEKVFLHYTVKQWGLRPDELDPSVSGRVPIRLSEDDRYFEDTYQFMPADGYSTIFARMLSHPLIEVRTETSFKDIVASESFDRIVFTGPIDEFFDFRHGPLPYRSIRFDNRTVASEDLVQASAVENYPTPASEHAFTRSTEYRFLTGQSGIGFTTQTFEFPEPYILGKNEPYYPVPREDNRALFHKYRTDADKLETVVFAGRLADYSYYNMDQAVGAALACFEKRVVGGASVA
ncbi:MAG: UDP-galactopyranose mutase [Hyphomonadaceae bacterium]